MDAESTCFGKKCLASTVTAWYSFTCGWRQPVKHIAAATIINIEMIFRMLLF